MKKKLAMLLAAVMLLTCCLAGCGSKDTPASTTTDPRPVDDSLLTVAFNLSPSSLDFQSVALSSGGNLAGIFMFDTLVKYDAETGSVQPAIAESWEWMDDTTLRMHLRKDVVSHNGYPITAEDVLYMFERGCACAALARYLSKFDAANTKVVDEYTIDVALPAPSSVALKTLAMSCFFVSSKAGIEAQGGLGAFARNPQAATGPYKFVEWVEGDHILVERNDEYWGNKAFYKQVNIRFISDDSSRLMALQGGDVAAVNKVLASQSSTVDGTSATLVSYDNQLQMYSVILNCADGLLADVRVRQAMNCAVQREAAVATILFGQGTVADGVFPSGFSLYSAPASGDTWTYDLEKAKSLMAEAGYADGFEMTLILYENQTYSDIAEFVESAWSELNIKVNIQTSDSGTFFGTLGTGEYDGYVIATSGVDYTATFKIYDNRLTYAQGCNSQYAGSAEYLAALDTIYSATDEAELMSAAAVAQSALRQEVPCINLMNGNILFAVQNGLTGYSVGVMGDPDFTHLRPAA